MTRVQRTMPGDANDRRFGSARDRAVQMMSVVGRVSQEQAEQAVTAEAVKRVLYGDTAEHQGADDMADFSEANPAKVRLGLGDRELVRIADEFRSRQVLRESVQHMAHRPAQCHGESCKQGRRACTERCGAEMACAEADDGSESFPFITPNGAIALAIGLAGIAACAGYYFFPAFA